MKLVAVRLLAFAAGLVLSIAIFGTASAQDAVRKELTPTGKLRVGIALALTPGIGSVSIDASGEPRGVSAELGRALAKRLGAQVEWVPYTSLGALTTAAASGAWDVAFIPVDEAGKEKVDFGAAYIVLQSTFLVAPGSKIQTFAEVDKPGVRVVGVQNSAIARAAQASLKNVTITYAKSPLDQFEMLRRGKADAIAQSRELLTQMAARLPGARLLAGAFLNSYVAVAVPKNRPAALAYASAFVEQAKAAGLVRGWLDSAGLRGAMVAPAGAKP
jgi:polar amino acid transport system substrate-binding protein